MVRLGVTPQGLRGFQGAGGSRKGVRGGRFEVQCARIMRLRRVVVMRWRYACRRVPASAIVLFRLCQFVSYPNPPESCFRSLPWRVLFFRGFFSLAL